MVRRRWRQPRRSVPVGPTPATLHDRSDQGRWTRTPEEVIGKPKVWPL